MSRYYYNPPMMIKKTFNSFIWESKTGGVLLTFDDGPVAETTPLILKALQNYNIKAAFFCVGNNISKNPGLAKEILSAGHEICNHTYNHKIITKISRAEAIQEIKSFISVSEEKLNYTPRYFRPPHGRFGISTGRLLKKFNEKVVLWSLMTHDYKGDFNVVKFAVSNYLRENSLIVLHDSLKSKEIIPDSISFIVDNAMKKGYRFGAPAECLK